MSNPYLTDERVLEIVFESDIRVNELEKLLIALKHAPEVISKKQLKIYIDARIEKCKRNIKEVV